MSDVIDIKTRKNITEQFNDVLMNDWIAFANKHLDGKALTIYFSKEHNNLAFIAPNQETLVKMVVGSYELLKAGGIILVKRENLFKRILRRWKKD